jgi:predicted dehydrogenase
LPPAARTCSSVFSTIAILGEKAMITYGSDNIFKITTDKEEKETILIPNDAYEAELKYFIDCIDQGRKPELANINQVELPVEISCAIVNSSKGRCLVRMG